MWRWWTLPPTDIASGPRPREGDPITGLYVGHHIVIVQGAAHDTLKDIEEAIRATRGFVSFWALTGRRCWVDPYKVDGCWEGLYVPKHNQQLEDIADRTERLR